MNKKIRDRRRDINRQRGRRRASLVLLGVLVLIALGCFVWLRSSDVFAVKRVTANPTAHVTAEEIQLVARDAIGENLLRLSTKHLKEELLSLPYVRTAEVYRRFPDTLHVRIEEYEPVARVRLGEDTWVVASEGWVLERALPSHEERLPLVVADLSMQVRAGSQVPESVRQALELTALFGEAQDTVDLPAPKYISVSPAGWVTLVFQDGSEARLGEPNDLDRKLRVVSKIIKEYLRQGRQLQYVDVSVPDRAAVAGVMAD